jgi:hypothetical protein
MVLGGHHDAISDNLSKLDPRRALLVRQRLQRLQTPVPLTSTQEGIWLAERMEPGRSGYHDVPRVRLRGPLDRACLERALADVHRRHEALRCRIVETEEGLGQRFDAPAPDVAFTDLSDTDGGSVDRAVERLTATDALRPFDLETGPLWRARLIRMNDTDHVLSLVIHHLVTDGHSHGVLLATLGEAYLRRLRTPSTPPAADDGEYGKWVRAHTRAQRTAETGDDYHRARRRLAGAPTRLPLPGLREPKAGGSRRTSRLTLPLGEEDWNRFAAACRRAGATRFTALLGTFANVCARLAGATDAVVAAPVAQRDAEGSATLLGCMVDRVPVRVERLGDATPQQAWIQARGALAAALEDRFVPYAALAREHPATPGNEDPLTNVAVQENNAPTAGTRIGDLDITPMPRTELRVRHDLVLSVGRERADDVELQWPADRWEDEAVARFAETFAAELGSACAPPANR